MMQKYFGLGKEYLTKKIQQFNAVSSDADYLTQQIPSRLRQPLAVLQQEQIDIEDAHAYENYYKNYPNHHISHFLLDKYNMMVQAEAQPNKYVSPVGEDSQILHFDSKLENKALLLRQAIQQYDEGFCKTDDPIVCLTVINFHHKRGTQVEYRYPQNKEIESLEQSIIHHAMPDSSHNKPEDYNFFNFEAEYKGKKRMLFGVSYFKQIKLTEEMKKQNSQLTRSYLQKAVAIISVVPLFGYLKIKLSFTTKFFFVNFRSFGIIQEAYKEINSHLAQAWPNIPISDLNIGTDLRSILQIFDIVDFYEIWKAVLYQKRIVVYGHSSSSVSSFLLSLLSLFPGQNTFGIFSKPIAKYMQSLRQLALPLKLFNSDNFLMFSFHIQNYTLLNKFKKLEKGNYLIGTTNRLVKQSKDIGVQLLVNLENCTIEKKNSRRPWQPMNRKQKTFINQLAVIAGKQKGLTYQRSQDSIRDHFHNFLKGALVELITAIRSFQKFTKQCLLFSQQSQQQKPSNNNRQQSQAQFFPPLLPEQVKKMTFPELLLQKSFAYFRQFKNENFPEIIKGKQIPSLYINNYDYYLRLNSQDFIVYNWLDKKLSFGKGSNTKNFEGKQIRFKTTKDGEGRQETKSIYVGNIQNGKFQKNGFYVDAFQRYEGEYSNGAKEGYGKYITGNQKYIGDFVNNIYEGQGQLLIGTDVYVGSFKNGLKSGYGTMQGTMQFDGFWEDNKPKISMKQVKAKEEHERNYKNVEEGEQDSEVPVKKSDFSAKLEKKVEKIIKEIQGKGESEVKNMENVATNRTQKTKTKQNTKNEEQQQKHQEKQDRQKIEAKQEQQKKEKVENEQRTEEKVKQQAQEQRTSQKIEQKVEVEVKTETNEQMGQQNKEEKAENE